MSKNENLNILLEKAKEVGKAMGDVACDIVDASKKKIEETRLRHDLEEAYEALGKLYYEVLKNGNNKPEKTEQLMAEIDCLQEQLRQNIEKGKKRDDTHEAPVTCPHCGGINYVRASYCSFCGKLIHSEQSDTAKQDGAEE